MNEKELIYSHIYVVNGKQPTAIQRFFVICTISALFFKFFSKRKFIQSSDKVSPQFCSVFLLFFSFFNSLSEFRAKQLIDSIQRLQPFNIVL